MSYTGLLKIIINVLKLQQQFWAIAMFQSRFIYSQVKLPHFVVFKKTMLFSDQVSQ